MAFRSVPTTLLFGIWSNKSDANLENSDCTVRMLLFVSISERDLDKNTYVQCTGLVCAFDVCALRTRVITMSTASWTGLRKKKTLETRNEPEQNEIRSVTVTHQFNENIVRGKKPKVGGKKLR